METNQAVVWTPAGQLQGSDPQALPELMGVHRIGFICEDAYRYRNQVLH